MTFELPASLRLPPHQRATPPSAQAAQASPLIDSPRVQSIGTSPSWRPGFELVGFFRITIPVLSTDLDPWARPEPNYLSPLAREAFVDGIPDLVVPVFSNPLPTHEIFSAETRWDKAQINSEKPAILLFLGNGQEHYAMRFASFADRDLELRAKGSDLGRARERLIVHQESEAL